jgi:hypothetical protein
MIYCQDCFLGGGHIRRLGNATDQTIAEIKT